MSQVAELFDRLTDRFYAPAAKGMDAVYQFDILDAGNYYITICENSCSVCNGKHEAPSITLTLESETLSSVIDGSLSGAQAFMFGKVNAQGQLSLATRLAELFSA